MFIDLIILVDEKSIDDINYISDNSFIYEGFGLTGKGKV